MQQAREERTETKKKKSEAAPPTLFSADPGMLLGQCDEHLAWEFISVTMYAFQDDTHILLSRL